MKVNTVNLKNEVTKLNLLLEEYESIYLNLYNEIQSTSHFWNDPHSIAFLDYISLEKQEIIKTYNELQDIKEVYDYLLDKYQLLGKKIEFNLKLKDEVILKLNNYIYKINDIIRCYNNLDLSFCSEAYLLKNERKILMNMKKTQKN